MSTPPTGATRSSHSPTALAGALAVSVALSACTSSQTKTATTDAAAAQSSPAHTEVTSRLQKRMAREIKSPVASARTAPAPTGVAPDQIAALKGEALVRARTPTDEALAGLAELLPDPRPPAPRAIGQADADAALRAYITGRAARLGGDFDVALAELERSARLNPNPAEPWREMAEVYLARGDRHSAERDFQRAFDRNPTDPSVLERTALLPVEGSPSDAIAGALARLHRIDPGELDPAMPYLVPAGLGRVLVDRGYAAAGAEMLQRAADLPTSFGQATNFREALSDLYRRRGELYRDAGDAQMRLDQPAEALALYDLGSQLPLLDPDSMLGHRVAALLRMGRPAAAAAIVLVSIEERDGQIRPLHVELLGDIAAVSETGPAIIESLRDQEARVTPEVARATHQTRIRAIAALLPPAEARAFLRREIVAQGADAALIADLYGRLDATDPAAPVREAILLTDLDPASVDRYVEALVTARSSLADLLEQSAAVTDQGHPTFVESRALVHARLLMLVGQYQEALSTLQSVGSTDDLLCAAQLERIRAMRAVARYADARAALDTVDIATCPSAIVGKAELLAEFDRPADALEMLDRAEENPDLSDPERARIALLAARILTSERRYPEAERRYRQVLVLDPTNEAGYAGLLTLFAQGGAMADERKLMTVVRDLRDTAPESRTFRMLRARDLLARNRTDLAEREFLEILDRYPDDSASVNLLVRIWTEQDRLDHAEAWLRERLERMPGSRADRIELARVLVDSQRAREAAALLEAWLALSPADQPVSMTLESVYRDALDDPAYATQLARQRLELAPVTIDTLGEIAVLQLATLRADQAQASVSRMLDLAVSTGRTAGPWSNRIASEVGDQLKGQAIDPAIARAILDDLALRVPDLSEGVHLARVQLLGLSEVPVQSMIDAADLAGQRYPQARDRAFDILLEAIRSGQVLRSPEVVVHQVDVTGGVRRPLDAPEGDEREQFEAARDRMTMAFTVIDHLREARPGPMRTSTSALALDIAMRIVQAGGVTGEPYLAASVDDMLNRPDRDDVIAAWVRLNPDFVEGSVQNAVTRAQRADACDWFSSVLHNAGDDQRADTVAWLALEFEPDHPTANNNLGYRFLERDENIDEAVALIERAYLQSPDAPNVIDSMAWAMYKIGVVHDEFAGDGAFIRPGAVSLLKKAVKLVEDRNNTVDMFFMRPVLLEHLGDAQWAAGDEAAATANWREALRFVDSMLVPKRRQQFSVTPDAAFHELERAGTRLRAKTAAIDAGDPPPIALIHRPINSAPPATHEAAPDPADAGPDDPPLGDEPPGMP